jgi:hypothetical protein
MRKVAHFAASICVAGSLTMTANNAHALAGFGAGYAAACGVCDAAIQSAFTIVDSSIIASEQILLESMGMGASMATGAVGFPMLQSTIESTTGQQTQQIVTALELATKQIANEVRTMPMKQQSHVFQQTLGEAAIRHTEDRKAQIDAGKTFNLGGDSSLFNGLEFLRGKMPVIGSDLSANQRANRTLAGGGGSTNSMTDQQALSQVATNVRNSTRISQSQALKLARQAAEDEDASLYEVLGGNLLISDKYTTIEEGSLEDDNLDLLSQIALADLPSTADATQQLASTNAEINRVVDDKINRMSMTIPMAIQDRFVRMRRAHEGSLGAEEYMLSAIGEQVDGPVSDEEFLRIMGVKRSRDARWMAIVANDDRFAAQELAQMEADHLYIKYQKLLAKRDLNMALAQVVSKILKKERP